MADPARDAASVLGKFIGAVLKEGLREEAYKASIRALEAELAVQKNEVTLARAGWSGATVETGRMKAERDAALAKARENLEAEHELSNAYIRLREILGALNTHAGENVWKHTEAKAREAMRARAASKGA